MLTSNHRLAVGSITPLFIFTLLFGSISLHNPDVIATTQKKIADFSLKDINGKTFRLSDYLGKKVIMINFWATWCLPCKQEMPQLQSLWRKYKDKDFLLLSISIDSPSTRARVKPYIKSRHYSFRVLIDSHSQVLKLYNPKSVVPYSMIIGKDGTLQYEQEGYRHGDETRIESMIKKLLSL